MTEIPSIESVLRIEVSRLKSTIAASDVALTAANTVIDDLEAKLAALLALVEKWQERVELSSVAILNNSRRGSLAELGLEGRLKCIERIAEEFVKETRTFWQSHKQDSGKLPPRKSAGDGEEDGKP